MKAISLWQPWSSAIALGYKVHETRHWTTRHRGPIAIHAAKRWTTDEREWCEHFAMVLGDPRLLDPPRGAIIAVADLVSVKSSEALAPLVSPTDFMLGNYGPERYGWRLEDVVALTTPIAYTGRQGIFEVPDDIIEAALAETRAAI